MHQLLMHEAGAVMLSREPLLGVAEVSGRQLAACPQAAL